MPDHIKVLGWKVTFPKGVVLLFGILFLSYIAPIDQFNPLRNMNFQSLIFGIWFFVSGMWFVIESFASMPDAKRGASKTGGIIVLAMGILLFGFGIAVMLGGINVVTGDVGYRLLATLLLSIGTLTFFVTMYPEVVHRKNFIKWLATM